MTYKLPLIVLLLAYANRFIDSSMVGVYSNRPCASRDCRYGSCEIYNQTAYICHCPKGVTGDQCNLLAKKDDRCSSKPCLDGNALCNNVGNDNFTCKCSTGRGGKLCEFNVGECRCQFGACVRVDNSNYKCDCNPSYGGSLCQYYTGAAATTNSNTITQSSTISSSSPSNQIECPVDTCQNGGTCLIKPDNSFECKCRPGITGNFCEKKGVFCPPNPCKNGGLCDDMNGRCICPPNYTGLYCESIGCSPNPCLNEQRCFNTSSNTFCFCSNLFSGNNCEFKKL